MNASLKVAGSKLCHTWSRRKLYQCQSTQCLPRPADADAGEHAFSYQLTRSPNSKVHAFVNLDQVQLSVTQLGNHKTPPILQTSPASDSQCALHHYDLLTAACLVKSGEITYKAFCFAAKLPHGRRSCCMHLLDILATFCCSKAVLLHIVTNTFQCLVHCQSLTKSIQASSEPTHHHNGSTHCQ